MTTSTDQKEPGVGHNLPPPVDLELAQDTASRLKPRVEHLLEQGAKIPEEIAEDQIGEVADFIKAVTATVKAIEAARVGAKEPFLTAQRQVDGLFGAVRDPLQKLKGVIEGRLGIALRAKERREREIARIEAERKRLEAEERKREADERARIEREAAEAKRREAEAAAAKQRRLEAEAAERNRQSTAALERARREAEERKRDAERADIAARKQERVAEGEQRRVDAAVIREAKVETAKPATFAKTRGEYGGVASAQRFWTYADVDRDTLDLERLRGLIPMEALEHAIRAFIAAGGRELAGVRIYEDDRTRVS